jgi:hypothetical protein
VRTQENVVNKFNTAQKPIQPEHAKSEAPQGKMYDSPADLAALVNDNVEAPAAESVNIFDMPFADRFKVVAAEIAEAPAVEAPAVERRATDRDPILVLAKRAVIANQRGVESHDKSQSYAETAAISVAACHERFTEVSPTWEAFVKSYLPFGLAWANKLLAVGELDPDARRKAYKAYYERPYQPRSSELRSHPSSREPQWWCHSACRGRWQCGLIPGIEDRPQRFQASDLKSGEGIASSAIGAGGRHLAPHELKADSLVTIKLSDGTVTDTTVANAVSLNLLKPRQGGGYENVEPTQPQAQPQVQQQTTQANPLAQDVAMDEEFIGHTAAVRRGLSHLFVANAINEAVT